MGSLKLYQAGGLAGWLAGVAMVAGRRAGGLIFDALNKTWLCGSWM